MRILFLGVATALSVILLVGCGGHSKSSPPSSASAAAPVSSNTLQAPPSQTATRGSSIQVNAPAATPAPTVALTRPNGGEGWWGTRDILWTTTSLSPGTVQILLSTDSGATWPTTIAVAAPDTGSYSWDTGALLNSTTCRVRVIATDTLFQSSVPADSAADFALVNAGLLYALEFDAPHQLGQRVATGAGATPRATPSTIQFGTPTIVPGPALRLDSFDNQGDQIRLELGSLPAYTKYTLYFDVTVQAADANAQFTMLFDTPQVRTLNFDGAGRIRPFVPGVTSGQVIGTFTNGTTYTVRIDVDLTADKWRIFLNGTLIFTSRFGGSTQISSVRFSSNVTSNPPRVQVDLDTILLIGN